jgi:capsular exopolysaccharide synthesis family protein
VSIRSQEQVALLTDYDPGSAYSAAYYTFFANIRFNWNNEQRVHTLLLTTPTHHAGQATIAANTAIAAAQSGTPTIVVDADLRGASLEQRFGLEKSAGLSDLLAEDVITTERVRERLRETFVAGLRLLSVGTVPEGSPSLLSTKLQAIIQHICLSLSETDNATGIVIFNCPPVLAGPDASLIGALTEQTFLTIAKGRTTRSQAKQAQEQLERAHANLVGIVMLEV